jgi:PAS domain S-box-containing protein
MKTVLVVDNQPLILKFMKELVERRGHRAILARSGLEALEVLQRVIPDVVFVDLVMPNIDGQKLCGIIRSDQRLSRTKVVLLSAIASEESPSLDSLGADLCIAKGPIPQMARHVEAALDDQVPWGAHPPLVLGSDTIQPREVTAELLATKRHLELILEHMSEGILELSPDGRVLFANPGAAKTLGRPELELLGKKTKELIPGEAGWEVERLAREAMKKREPLRASRTLKLGPRRVRAEFLPFTSNNTGTMVIFSDVTEIHRTAEILQHTLDGAPLPALMIDTEHRVTLWNRAMESLTGVPRERVIGKPVDSSIFYPDGERPLLADLVLEMDMEAIGRWYGPGAICPHPVLSQALEGTGNFVLSGRTRTLHFLASRICDSEGLVLGAIETIQDITEREELHRHLQHAQKMQAVGTLAAGMAHEFNNILAAIQGYAQLLGFNLAPGDPNEEYLREIEASCQRAAGLIRKILAFSRMERGDKLPVKINQVLEGVVQMLRQTLPPKIQILVELEPGLPFVYGEHPQLEQVFLNLCLNARDALPQGGEIRLCTSQCYLEESFCRLHPWARPGHYVTVRIEDNGVGMPPEVLERVFEPFFTTKEPGKGTGLGLTIAYSIVKSHEGHILAESPGSSGGGSRFTIFLPALEEHLEEHDESSEPSPTCLDEAQRGRGQRILLVDDEPQLLEIGKKMLVSHNYRVDTASNGREALAMYARELGSRDPYRLVILDMAMPVMDGGECLARILEIDPAAKVVVSTGTALGASSAEPPFSEATGLLQKPFDLELLLRTVRKALEGGCEP